MKEEVERKEKSGVKKINERINIYKKVGVKKINERRNVNRKNKIVGGRMKEIKSGAEKKVS